MFWEEDSFVKDRQKTFPASFQFHPSYIHCWLFQCFMSLFLVTCQCMGFKSPLNSMLQNAADNHRWKKVGDIGNHLDSLFKWGAAHFIQCNSQYNWRDKAGKQRINADTLWKSIPAAKPAEYANLWRNFYLCLPVGHGQYGIQFFHGCAGNNSPH